MTRSAGDFDYEHHDADYAGRRRTDPAIAAFINGALGSARTVLNVGAGAGSYEPTDRYVVAVEPSAAMRAQRPRHLAPAVDARADHLPFADGAFDASMATVTVHQWPDPAVGLAEMRRVTRGPVVILTFDADALADFWLNEYAPELMEAERRRYPTLDAIGIACGPEFTVTAVPVPVDCRDGFWEAFYGRPEALLEPEVRAAQSAWGFIDASVTTRALNRLAADLESGAWDARYGALRTQAEFGGSLRLVVGNVPGTGRPPH